LTVVSCEHIAYFSFSVIHNLFVDMWLFIN